MVTPLGGAVEWLAVAPAEALTPLVGLHRGVDEWLDVADRERQVGVIPEVPILIGLVVDGTASDLDWALDVRVIDFMNHPAGAAVSSPLDRAGAAVSVAGVLSVAGGSGQGVGCGHDAGFRGL